MLQGLIKQAQPVIIVQKMQLYKKVAKNELFQRLTNGTR